MRSHVQAVTFQSVYLTIFPSKDHQIVAVDVDWFYITRRKLLRFGHVKPAVREGRRRLPEIFLRLLVNSLCEKMRLTIFEVVNKVN